MRPEFQAKKNAIPEKKKEKAIRYSLFYEEQRIIVKK
jgi:hypothetical protein